MMHGSINSYWSDYPIFSWVVDDFEQYNEIIKSEKKVEIDLSNYEKTDAFEAYIKLVTQSPVPLNLGGQEKKNKLIITDKSTGVFNFSLASKTLFPVSEFYSQRLALEKPQRFKDLNFPSGIVPNIMVEKISSGDNIRYAFTDTDNIEYPCEKRIKGETAILDGIPNAKKEYKSKTKKTFQFYKRNGGKVKYFEIYSLWYYGTKLDGDFKKAVRHLPIMMIADYLESVGVKVRIYVCRFVKISEPKLKLREFTKDTNQPLPMYKEAVDKFPSKDFDEFLYFQPIISKEFQQEVHNPMFGFSSGAYLGRNQYNIIKRNTYDRESFNPSASGTGDPWHSQPAYLEGFERYRNKYKEYVKLGLFKSKEVTTDAMVMFHDYGIENELNGFVDTISRDLNLNEFEVLLDTRINPFFAWWMRKSAFLIKHKFDLINSKELLKDLRKMKAELEEMQGDLLKILEDISDVKLKKYVTDISKLLAETYYTKQIKLSSGESILDFSFYVQSLLKELMVYARGGFFETPEEDIERREDLYERVDEELKNML